MPESETTDQGSPEKRRRDYNRLVRTARLSSLFLERVDFKVKPEAVGTTASGLTRDLFGKAEVMAYPVEDETCIVRVTWNTRMRLKRKVMVKCSAAYVVVYSGMQECSTETADIFVETVGRMSTYSYFRALYAHLDWSANLGSAPLPILQWRAKV